MSAMSMWSLLPTAAENAVRVVKGADGADLSAPTPCTDFDLRTLVNHYVGTTQALARVGQRSPLDPDDPYGSHHDASEGDWQRELSANLGALAEAWTSPDAWEGTVAMAGQPMPAPMIGEMALAEMLLHAWDLAAATGQSLVVPDKIGRELRRSIEETAELGRSMGAYGVEVAVRAQASEFERALAASGRDPRWRAAER
jgi:uncharacterized protein (TIGR03086 family)